MRDFYIFAACAASFEVGFTVGWLLKARWLAGHVREFIHFIEPLVHRYALLAIKDWWCT